jgi:hypothetical protein
MPRELSTANERELVANAYSMIYRQAIYHGWRRANVGCAANAFPQYVGYRYIMAGRIRANYIQRFYGGAGGRGLIQDRRDARSTGCQDSVKSKAWTT